jgi:iron complex transport system substrate-binding protein
MKSRILNSGVYALILGALILGFTVAILAAPASAGMPPKRIVSLSLASDEILLDLLDHCQASDRLVALSTFADDPSSSSVTDKAKRVLKRVHSEPESLFQLKPDLVIAASFNRPELLSAIKSKAINLLVLDQFDSFRDIANNIRAIGRAVHCVSDSEVMAKRFLEAVSTRVNPKATSRRAISYNPDLTVMGSKTIFDDIVTRADLINAAAERGLARWPKIDTEVLLGMNPDIIIVLGEDTPAKRAEIARHPAWGRLRSVRGQNLIFLRPATALSTSHYAAEALRELRDKVKSRQL